MKKHYLVYQITNLINDKIYIGIHITSNLEDGYMGSGTYLNRAIKKYGVENFKKEILFDFDNPEEMILKESELVDRKFIARKDVYNIKCGGEGWLTYDTISVRDADGNCFRIHKEDERYLNGELKDVNCGSVSVTDSEGNNLKVSINDPRYISGELKHNRTGFITVSDVNNNSFSILVDDPRRQSGELVSISKGKLMVKDKINNFFQVRIDDPRYLSGELIPFFSECKHSVEAKKKISENSKIHQKGEGNSQFGTCWIHRLDLKENKKIKKTELDSFLSEGWINGRKMKF